MKNLSLLFIAFLLLQFTTLAQQGWFWQNPIPQGNVLNSVKFTNSTTGWAVGGSGTILKTTNGGTIWTSQLSNTSNWLMSVHFNDQNTGWTVGDYGTILKTTDGGENWISKTSGTNSELWSVYFTNQETHRRPVTG